MKKGKYPNAPSFKLVMIDPDAEIVIDLIDFERIKAASSGIKFCHEVYTSLFSKLENAINSINAKSSNVDFDRYQNFPRAVCVMIDPDAEIVIDLIDFERIKAVSSAIKFNFDGFLSLFRSCGRQFGDAVILLEDAISNINNSISQK